MPCHAAIVLVIALASACSSVGSLCETFCENVKTCKGLDGCAEQPDFVDRCADACVRAVDGMDDSQREELVTFAECMDEAVTIEDTCGSEEQRRVTDEADRCADAAPGAKSAFRDFSTRLNDEDICP